MKETQVFLRQDISKANQFQILHFQILKMTKNNSATAISTGGGCIIPVMLPIPIVTMKDEKENNNIIYIIIVTKTKQTAIYGMQHVGLRHVLTV